MPANQRTFVVYTFGPDPSTDQPGTNGIEMPPEFSDRLLLRNLALVRSDRTADEIRDAFQETTRWSKILVIEAGDQAAWSGFNPIDADWMLNRLSGTP